MAALAIRRARTIAKGHKPCDVCGRKARFFKQDALRCADCLMDLARPVPTK